MSAVIERFTLSPLVWTRVGIPVVALGYPVLHLGRLLTDTVIVEVVITIVPLYVALVVIAVVVRLPS